LSYSIGPGDEDEDENIDDALEDALFPDFEESDDDDEEEVD
jgi:hypothetical protein